MQSSLSKTSYISNRNSSTASGAHTDSPWNGFRIEVGKFSDQILLDFELSAIRAVPLAKLDVTLLRASF